MNVINEILWFFAGSDRTILRKCLSSEQTKHAGIGATILITAVLAIFSGTYAAKTLTDNNTALWIGVFWGFTIFNIDRLMVGSMNKHPTNNKWKEVLHAFPRLLLAIVIALVVSKPVEIKILENQIDKQLVHFKIKERNYLSEMNKKNSKIDESIDSKTKIEQDIKINEKAFRNIIQEEGYIEIGERYNQCQNERTYYNEQIRLKENKIEEVRKDPKNLKWVTYYEVAGKKVTTQPPDSIDYTTKETRVFNSIGKSRYDALDEDLKDLRSKRPDCNPFVEEQKQYIKNRQKELSNEKSSLQSEKTKVETEITTKKDQLEKTDEENKDIIDKAGNDLFGKLMALEKAKGFTQTESDTLSNGVVHTITRQEKLTMRNISWAIMAFFFILELCPILVKIMTDRGVYEDTLEAKGDNMKEELKLQRERKKTQVKHKIDLDKEHVNISLDVGIDTESEIQREIAQARLEVAREVVEKWKEREKRRLGENEDAYLNEVVK